MLSSFWGEAHYLKILKNEKDYKLIIDSSSRQIYLYDAMVIDYLLEAQPGTYVLPQELEYAFNDTDGLLVDPNEVAVYLIENYGSEEIFIDLISTCNNEIIDHYLRGIDRVNLYSDDLYDDYTDQYQGKVVNLILKLKKYKEILFLDDKPIKDYQYLDEVTLFLPTDELGSTRKISYQLNVLLPGLSKNNSFIISKIKDKLPNIDIDNLFNRVEYELEQLFQELLKMQIRDGEQGSFMLAYMFLTKKFIDFNVQSSLEIPLLNALYRNNLFQQEIFKNIPFEKLKFNLFIYPESSEMLILPSESLDPSVKIWINNNIPEEITKRKDFLKRAGLQLMDSPVLKLRECFFNSKRLKTDLIESVLNLESIYIYNTFDWLYLQKYEQHFSISSDFTYYNFDDLVKAFYEKYKIVPRYLLSLSSIDIEQNLIFYKIAKTEPSNRNVFYKYPETKVLDNVLVFKKILEKEDLEIFCPNPTRIDNNFTDHLPKIGIYELTIGEKFDFTSVDIKNNEWKNSIYNEWLETENNNFKVVLLPKIIKKNYSFSINGIEKQIFLIETKLKIEAHRERYNDKEMLLLFPEINHDKEIIQLLVKENKRLFKNQEERDLWTNLLERFINSNDGNGGTGLSFNREITKEQFEPINNNIDSILSITQGADSSELSRLAQDIEKIKKVLEHADSDQLSRISKDIEKLNKLLEKVDSDLLDKLIENLDQISMEFEKEQREPKPVALIGYIGERLIYLWLKEKGRDCKYVGDHIWAYDIEYYRNDKSIKIDVKTTRQSIINSSEAIPFFVKKSQFKYISENPNEPYFIIQLSLEDLGLLHIYHEFKVKSADYKTITSNYTPEIDAALNKYLNDNHWMKRFRKLRSIFRMNFPMEDLKLFENF